jgi:hypothetical protein
MKSSEDITVVSEMTLEDARIAVMEIRQRTALMGANDSEFFALDGILDKLDKREIGPGKAVEEANLILKGKQDYH